MILGNTLNGISLAIHRLGSELSAKRSQVETLLVLGATRWEAARQPVQQAVRTGMIPPINSMMVVGIVSLPDIGVLPVLCPLITRGFSSGIKNKERDYVFGTSASWSLLSITGGARFPRLAQASIVVKVRRLHCGPYVAEVTWRSFPVRNEDAWGRCACSSR